MSDLFAPFDPGDPSDFPVGTRVILPDAEDFHFFRGSGVVARHTGQRYLGVVVALDVPYRCDHGHFQHDVTEFGFSASKLVREAKP